MSKEFNVDECMRAFFDSPTHRLIMAMFAVHDKEMTIDQAIDYTRTGLVRKTNTQESQS